MIDKKIGKRESKLPVEVNEDEFIELMEATNKIHHKIAFRTRGASDEYF